MTGLAKAGDRLAPAEHLLDALADPLGMVLSAGRSEDSLSVVLRTGRWLHDGVIGCGDLTDGRHRLRLDRLRPPKPA